MENKTKVFVYLCINSSDVEDVKTAGRLFTELEDAGVTIKQENGSQMPFDSEPIGFSFTGKESVIRSILSKEWFPDYENDSEWEEVEKVEV